MGLFVVLEEAKGAVKLRGVNAEEELSAMDPSSSGFVLDPSECHKLTIEEKRDLVHELSKLPEGAPEKLQRWSRKDLLEILCAEIGKERKYTGLTKQKLIENIFKIVSEKRSGKNVEDLNSSPARPVPDHQAPSKRPRKNDHPSRLPLMTNNLSPDDGNEALSNIRYCQNLACKATLKPEDAFCKRCSCCICHKYDENKDPSLWLFCTPETLSQGNSCGMSCHLECAIKHERAGIVKTGKCARLDGSYYCVYCGRVNDLLGCWKKQLSIAKDARRVDVLCYRISLSHKLLNLTEKYKKLHEMVDAAKKQLETEIAPVNGLPNMGRGIVNRLSVGAEVQRLCASAIDLLETMNSRTEASEAKILCPEPSEAQVQQSSLVSSSFLKFEGITPTSLSIVLDSGSLGMLFQEVAGFTLWHRKADIAEYPEEPTCTLFKPKERCLITDLIPATEYILKVVAFDNVRELGMWEVRVTTESVSMDRLIHIAPEVSTLKDRSQSPKANSSGLSNPSECYESNNNGSVYTDLNKSPESYFNDYEKPETLDLEKLPDHDKKYEGSQKSEYGGTASETEVVEPEETTGHSDSALDEEPISRMNSESHKDSTNSTVKNNASGAPKSDYLSNSPVTNDRMIVPFVGPDQTLPVTPSRVETGKEGSGRGSKVKLGSNIPLVGFMMPYQAPGSSSKKRCEGKFEELCAKECSLEGAYEYCVKMIRKLECEGHIDTKFRLKFLTWFSLRASLQERRIVNVYVNALIDDPASLAGQLVDTFSETISSQRPSPLPNGFCMKLWH